MAELATREVTDSATGGGAGGSTAGGRPPEQGGSILARTARGAGWTVGWRLVTRVLGVVSTLILVRFLLPADFGVVALGTAFVGAMEALTFLGVEDALVRQKSPTRAHFNTGFTLNVMRAALLAVVLAAAAVPAAGFFEEPRITHVLFVLAVATLMDGFINPGLVEFRRDFAFHREFQVLIVPRLVGLVAMIGTAVVFRSYWALMVGILSQRLMTVAFSYVLHPYRPRFGLSAWGDIAGYSMWNWIIALAALVRERSNAFALGHVMGATQVGIYSLGAEVALLPTTELIGPITRVAFSGFAAARNAGDETAESFLQMVAGAIILTLPAGCGLSLMAGPLVAVAFGASWGEAVPVVQILGVAGALSVFSYLTMSFMSAHAMLRTVLALTTAVAALRVALLLLLLVVWPLGLVGSAIAVAVSVVFGDVLCVLRMRQRFGVSLAELGRRIWRAVAATAAMAAVLLAVGLGGTAGVGAGQVWTLLGGSLLGAFVYCASLLLFWVASGRPAGAEAHMLRLAGSVLTRAGARLRRA